MQDKPNNNLLMGLAGAIALVPLMTLLLNRARPDLVGFLQVLAIPAASVALISILISYLKGAKPSALITSASPVGIVCIVGMIGCALVADFFNGPDIGMSVRFYMILLFILFGLGLSHLLGQSNKQVLSAFSLAFGLGMAIYAISIGVLFLNGAFPAEYEWIGVNQMPGFANIRHASFGIPIALCFGICFITYGSFPKGQLILIVALMAVLCGFMIWAGSRGGVLATSGALGITLLLINRNRMRLILTGAGVLILGMVLSFAYPQDHKTLGLKSMIRKTQEVGNLQALTSGRSRITSETIVMATSKPIFGHGIDQYYNTELGRKYNMVHAHNTFATYAFSIGFLGVGLLYLWLFRIWARFYRVARENDSAISIGAFSGLSSILIFGLVDGVLFHNESLFAIAILLGVGFANLTQVQKTKT